ncbi:mechanosensitive ion channel protein 8-like [Trifolium pratense]|uniref:mechanosensitive ion channel protein 8-like n=1 Tax=Trifolium pratense TaxID=57577 RepID=UPI001E6944F4|nr:mechanosensitive ion channel protein 8-like [Trifolium pratense]
MAQDHIVIKIPDDTAPSTSKIDENDSAKTSSTTKNDEIEEISDEDNNENQTVVEESPKVEEPPKVEESPKDQIGGLRRRIGQIVKSGRLSSRKDDDGEDDRLMEEGYQDEDKKKPYFGVWIHELIFFVIIGLFATTLKVPFLKGVKFWEVNLWKWVLLILFLICGGLISRWIVRVAVCIVEYKAPSMKKVLHVYIMSKIVEYFFWMVLFFTTWRCLFHERAKREKWTAYITKILIDFLAGVFVWLLKTLVVKVLTSNVYSTTYLERIKESLFDQFVIETLSGPPSAEIPKTGGRLSNGIGMDQLKKMDSNNVSAWKMKKLINLVCEEKLTMMGEHARHIESEDGANTVAQKIYENLDRRDDSFIYHEDVLKQYKVLNRKNLFEGAIDSGKISKSALEKWVMNAFRERRTLASALGNTKTVVKKVNRMLNIKLKCGKRKKNDKESD